MTSAPLPSGLDDALAALAGRRPLVVASDYDGVLARLRDDPAAAVPEPGVAEALARLGAVDGVTVALVSGRGVEDLQRTSGLTGPFRWVGSHGAEYDGPLPGELAGRRDELADLLRPGVAGTPGARLEVKPASVAVHVRQVADRDAAAALLARGRELADSSLTLKPGKDVLEIAVTDADKGSALQRLIAEVGAAAAIYLGDDVTDEDAFRALGPDDVTVKVGDGDTAANHRVDDFAGALAVLQRLGSLLA
ncbi:trehalose-phosphatase [Blastococcus saxobsidens]|uniref:Trehalose 6-phosphate phosphatase n=1 Tax=Blastococcus saxobsidens TaxID=138336 RepID=A0A4Q7YBB8_9ACTN|nr:trehalose-phosphatase [Blastococcus saxobsidens]RZU33733.1 trehalose 6-phosphatase [Blastococcus saxobsidens]